MPTQARSQCFIKGENLGLSGALATPESHEEAIGMQAAINPTSSLGWAGFNDIVMEGRHVRAKDGKEGGSIPWVFYPADRRDERDCSILAPDGVNTNSCLEPKGYTCQFEIKEPVNHPCGDYPLRADGGTAVSPDGSKCYMGFSPRVHGKPFFAVCARVTVVQRSARHGTLHAPSPPRGAKPCCTRSRSWHSTAGAGRVHDVG